MAHCGESGSKGARIWALQSGISSAYDLTRFVISISNLAIRCLVFSPVPSALSCQFCNTSLYQPQGQNPFPTVQLLAILPCQMTWLALERNDLKRKVLEYVFYRFWFLYQNHNSLSGLPPHHPPVSSMSAISSLRKLASLRRGT